MGKFLLVVVVFGAAVYTCFWLFERRRARSVATPSPNPSPPRRVISPDDDVDFLRELERRRRRAARDKQQDQTDSGDPTGSSDA